MSPVRRTAERVLTTRHFPDGSAGITSDSERCRNESGGEGCPVDISFCQQCRLTFGKKWSLLCTLNDMSFSRPLQAMLHVLCLFCENTGGFSLVGELNKNILFSCFAVF